MKFKVGDKVRLKKTIAYSEVEVPNGTICVLAKTSDLISEIIDPLGRKWTITTESIEPVDADGGKIAYAPNGAPLFWMPEPKKPVSIEEQLGLPKGVSIHDLPTSEWYRHFTVVKDEMDALEHMANNVCVYADITDFDAQKFKKRLADISARLKEEKKMPTKFTFYVTEGTRVDKSCNGTIPTMTTMVSYIDKYGCIMKGTATCDKADYDERQGVLEALANATCGDNFYKAYAEAIKFNRCEDELSRTCAYCGQLLDTREEREEHEAWHGERRKARHERYLLRKRAKEIAFEEQAQKFAKEIIAEDNKK